MASGDFFFTNRDAFALCGLVFAFVGVPAQLLSRNEAGVNRFTLVASFSAGCFRARFDSLGAFSHCFVATYFLAVNFPALRLAPLGGTDLVSHAWFVAHTFTEPVFRTKFVVAVLNNAILDAGLEAVLTLDLLVLDANLLAVVHLLHLLARLLAYTFLLVAHLAFLLAGRQETILDGATALLALGETGLIVTTVRFTTQHTGLTRLACLQASSAFGCTLDTSAREVISTARRMLGALGTFFAPVLVSETLGLGFAYSLALLGAFFLVHALSDHRYCALLLPMTAEWRLLNTVFVEGRFAIFRTFHMVTFLLAFLARNGAELLTCAMFSG